MFYSSVLERTDTGSRLRFDPLCMHSDEDGSIEAAQDCLRELAMEHAVNWETGDALVIDNWRCLHYRGRVTSVTSGRELMRLYWED